MATIGKIRLKKFRRTLPLIRLLLESYAKLSKKKFYCRSLNGKSYYNNVINSDLTFSCTCNDCFGLGKLGDLNKNNLQEIFFGKIAMFFRDKLDSGKIPIISCILCPDFCMIGRDDHRSNMDDITLPRAIMVENTVNCNLRCLSCNRDIITTLREKGEMSFSDILKISDIIRKYNVQTVSFFNLGEPFFSVDIKRQLEIIRADNPNLRIVISTNAHLIDTDEKRQAAMLADEIIISIHGSTQESLSRYQKGGNFNLAYENMKKLVTYRDSISFKKPSIKWKYVLFRWNDSKKLIENAIALAKAAGVDQLFFEKTISPVIAISYKHYLGIGYLNKIGKFEGKTCDIKLW